MNGMMVRGWWAAVFVALGVSGGCASSGPKNELTRFPSAEEVQALVDQPAPPVDLKAELDEAPVVQWALVGELPGVLGDTAHVPTTPWEREVQDKAAEFEGGRASQAMHCIARQAAHYHAEFGEFATGAVERFMAGRCGWVGSIPGMRARTWKGWEPEEAWNEVRAQYIAEMQSMGSEPMDFGIWVGKVGDRTFAILSYNRRRVTVQAHTNTLAAGTTSVTLEGRVLDVKRYDGVSGRITRGDFDMAFCEADEAVRFPAFRITCPVEAGDRMAWFDLGLHVRDEQWYNSGYIGLLWNGEADHAFRAAPWRRAWAQADARHDAHVDRVIDAALDGDGEEAQIHAIGRAVGEELEPRPLLGEHELAGDTLEERIVALVNVARGLAGRSPLTLATLQTRTNTALAPHFFRAHRAEDYREMDKYSAAILAGWDIEQEILSARLQTGSIVEGDERDLVENFLELPTGRAVLMHEDVGQVAFGTLQEGKHIWTVVTGYRKVPQVTGEEMVARAIATINAARAEAGVGPLVDAERYQQAAMILSNAIIRGDRTPAQAADRIAQAMVNNLSTEVVWWTIITDDLERIRLPDPIVQTPGLRAAIVAAPWRASSEPWMMYRVIIITPERDLK